MFGAPRLVHFDQIAADPGALSFAGEMIIGLALPWFLLRRTERIRGYAALAGLGVLAALAIGPVTAIVRGLADRV